MWYIKQYKSRRNFQPASCISALKLYFLFPLLLLLSFHVYSQDVVYWRAFASTNEWDYGGDCLSTSVGGNWHYTTTGGGDRKRPDCFAYANRIHFDNAAWPIMNLNSSEHYAVNQILFEGSTGSRTINTDNSRSLYFKQNGGNAKIENYVSSTTHTFNVDIIIDNTSTTMEFNPVNGDLVFNNTVYNNSGNTILIWGNEKVTFTADISSSTGTPGITVNGNATTVFIGTSKTYSGTTTIKNGGTLQISSDQSLGAITLETGGNLIVDAGITLTITGTWTGGGTIENNGKIILTGPSAFPGSSTTINAMNDLTINNSSGITLDKNLTIDGTLNLSSGNFNLGNNILTMGGSSLAISGTFSASRMIIADGGGEIRKQGTSATEASFTFPIGDNTGTTEYSPITLTFSGGTYAGYAGVKVTNTQHPSDHSTSDYLTRYWTVTQSGYTGPVSILATYLPADLTGTEGSITSAEYSSSAWKKYSVIAGGTLTAANVPAFTSADFGGITNPVVSISPTTVSLCQNDPSPTLSASAAGAPAITYLWNDPGGSTSSSISPSTATVGTITYTVTITDGNGLTASSSGDVTVNALPVTSHIYHN